MNPDQPSREQIETRITALLLDELPADEAALLRYTISQDPALKKLHDQIESTLPLVREAARQPGEAPLEKPAPIKMSAERREKLLAHFKTAKPKQEQPAKEPLSKDPLFWLKRIKAPTFVEVLVVIAIIAMVSALLLPSLSKAKRKEFAAGSSIGRREEFEAQLKEAESTPLSTSPVPEQQLSASGLNGKPQIFTASPEPAAATPAPPTPIALPTEQPEAGQLAIDQGTRVAEKRANAGNFSAGPMSADTLAGHVIVPKNSQVYSQNIVGYSGVSAGTQSTPASDTGAASADGSAHYTFGMLPAEASAPPPPPVAANPEGNMASLSLSAGKANEESESSFASAVRRLQAATKNTPPSAPNGEFFLSGAVPQNSPQTVSVAPEPSLAPPPATPSTMRNQGIGSWETPPSAQIVLPQTEPAPEVASTLDQDGKVLYESGNFAEAEKKLKQADSLNPNDATAANYLGLIAQQKAAKDEVLHNPDTQERMEHVEKEWVLPKNANPETGFLGQLAPATSTTDTAKPASQSADSEAFVTRERQLNNNGDVTVNFDTSAGGGGGGGGFGGGGGRIGLSGKNTYPSGEDRNGWVFNENRVTGLSLTQNSPQVAPAQTPGVPMTTTFALDDSGLDGPRAQNQTFGPPAVSPATANPIGAFPGVATTAPAASEAASDSTKSENPERRFESAVTPRGTGTVAGNRFYRNPTSESDDKKVPMAGDIPVMGRLFQSSTPASIPAPAQPAAPPADTFALNNGSPEQTATVLQNMFQGNNTRSTQYSPLQSRAQSQSVMSPTTADSLAIDGGIQQQAAEAPHSMHQGSQLPLRFNLQNAPGSVQYSPLQTRIQNSTIAPESYSPTSTEGLAKFGEEQRLPGVASAAPENLDEDKKMIDAERKREIAEYKASHQNHGFYSPSEANLTQNVQLDQPEATHGPDNHFVSRYAYNTAPIVSTNYIAINGALNDSFNPGVSAIVPNTTESPAAPQNAGELIAPGEVNFQGADISEVLDVYAKLTGRTLLRGALPQKQIILNTQSPLTKAETIDALQTTLARNGVSLVNVGDKFVKALPSDQAGTAGGEIDRSSSTNITTPGSYVTRVVQLKHVKPTDMVSVIQPFAGLANSILPMDNDGLLVLRDKAENVDRMMGMIDQVDVSGPTEVISEVVPIHYAKVDDIASALKGVQLADRAKIITNPGGSGGLLIYATRGDMETIKENIAKLDTNQTDLPLRQPAPNTPVPQPEILTSSNAFSTFAMNVSDVSFRFAEASLQNGKLPDTASIRSEEFVNAFDYRDPEAAAGQPMAFTSEQALYPFAHNRELLRFSVKAAAAGRQEGRPLNLVLLLDTSGSMERADRVEIVREALHVLGTQLHENDVVSVVSFARTARLWADGVPGDKAGATLDQVGGITPEGGTNLEEAMRLAYETARRHYLANGMNRVVLLTDGAANLGNVDPAALEAKVETQRKQGIALDCFGIGWEDLNDDLLEELSSHGDGRYAFLNSPEDATKDFAAKLAGALQVAAQDLKVQVEFNPQRVTTYRQIGYAKHQLTKEQFRDNTVAAGEIASQEAGNALYTIQVNPDGEGPIATVHVRYRVPGTQDYHEHSWDVEYTGHTPALDQSSPAMRLAATASAFSEWLAASPYAQEVTPDALLNYLSGVPEVYGADDRPKQLETMIREAKSLEGK